MPIVGLVITLDPSPDRAALAKERLRADPRFTLGPEKDGRIAAVLETADLDADRRAWEDLITIPGVQHGAPVFAAHEPMENQ